ncbi:C-type lectin domain family 17, member A-like isoform X1 [Salmo trutta]|uniref:C-type lectin domain family 17, member A-like n=1 Tax=Salmo trutta TaxID=8032 RepID=A0A673VM56_SALTR|nr:C-type lectin domain family 17, member A-like isoform X1 [Salmo trutta]
MYRRTLELRLEEEFTVFDHKCVKMSEGVYENSYGFEDDEPDAMKNTDIDGKLYANVRAFKPSPRNGVVASVHVQWWKRPSGVAAVCLGLLCVLLLAGIIGLSVYYGVIGHHNSTERDQLLASYSNLTKERDQLQTSYNNLTKERDQLQTERDFLSGRFTNLKQTCPEGWQKFESSWYFLSTETKTWKESRKDCMERGADLVIINSDKEQEFLFNLNKGVWIGLTDSVTEGTLIWVDGTPLTNPRFSILNWWTNTDHRVRDDNYSDNKAPMFSSFNLYFYRYWHKPQPDNGAGRLDYGEEDCVEIRKDQRPLEAWNDLSCDRKIYWVCEKVV